MTTADSFTDYFNFLARTYDVEVARSRCAALPGVTEDILDQLTDGFSLKLTRITESEPAVIRPAGLKPWYSGTEPGDVRWASLRNYYLHHKNRPEDQVNSVDTASDVIIAHTPKPTRRKFQSRGLVVGYIQSGKTTNFTAVAAKAADLGYHLVIVLSGIHNSLRKQTQKRLDSELTDLNTKQWLSLTTPKSDFYEPTFRGEQALGEGKPAGLMVVKKNAAVLGRLEAWLDTKAMREHLKNLRVLVIDDEADQASIDTNTINGMISRILKLMPRNTYIGYTATPFANVFVDPTNPDDFYPRSFILNLPRPEGYFGPEMIFGRPDAENDSEDSSGYDMVRIVHSHEVSHLAPASRDDIPTFIPTAEGPLEDALNWYFLATAARFARGHDGHSSMLIHTHISTEVHESFRAPLEAFREDLLARLKSEDNTTFDNLQRQWDTETQSVPAAEFGLHEVPFDQVRDHLLEVVERTRIVLDNYKSKDRLDYSSGASPQLVIAVGANTLSRGLTLEGLVSSVFVRYARAYDTLLQMGRWFGFRNGYEDLPRIWMTEELQNQFRHLAQVEHEMRMDIDRYQEQDLTPLDLAVRIQSHPSLAITAKMGAARPAYISFSGHALTTRYFDVTDPTTLRSNIRAASTLASEVTTVGTLLSESSNLGRSLVYDDVPARCVLGFLSSYSTHDSQANMAPELLSEYIRECLAARDGYLESWTVAFIAGNGSPVSLGALGEFPSSRRSAETDDPTNKRIHTLSNPTDFGLGLGMSRSELRKATGGPKKVASDPRMLTLRSLNHDHCQKGILLIYAIDPISEPENTKKKRKVEKYAIDAAEGLHPIGFGIGFPDPEQNGATDIRKRRMATHMAVDLPDRDEYPEELHDILFSDTEEY
ncbi:Z1 domain-containing protein [Corynebacterium xerosis]|uniref:Z1 domain-containing protein n=1 Tax=Corynebacterium xerosis TaxID=1725 RepID=UPI0009EA7BB0|nr:Z1 domain-containing protein [Corynebacterium xerosis]